MWDHVLLTITLANCAWAAAHDPEHNMPRRHLHQHLARLTNLESPPHNEGDVLVQIKPVDDADSAGTTGSEGTSGGAQWLSFAASEPTAIAAGTAMVNLAATGSSGGQSVQNEVEGAQSINEQPSSPEPSFSGLTGDTGGGEPGPVPQDQADRWVKAHNDARSAHGAGELQWREDLAWGAKSNAEQCKAGHTSFGENIATTTADMSPEWAVEQWMNGADLWDGKFKNETAHFSQVVWKVSMPFISRGLVRKELSSQFLGCFIQECQPGTRYAADYGISWVATCRYDPPGNNEAGSAMTNNVQ